MLEYFTDGKCHHQIMTVTKEAAEVEFRINWRVKSWALRPCILDSKGAVSAETCAVIER